jgi:hypothetical protein
LPVTVLKANEVTGMEGERSKCYNNNNNNNNNNTIETNEINLKVKILVDKDTYTRFARFEILR